MELIQQIKNILTKVLSDKGSAYLFGSRARGNANSDSDWDILVILDKAELEIHDYDNITFPLSNLGWNENQYIDPIMYTRQEWEKQSFTPFYKNVEREKIILI